MELKKICKNCYQITRYSSTKAAHRGETVRNFFDNYSAFFKGLIVWSFIYGLFWLVMWLGC